MKNVTMTLKGDFLTIVVDLSETFGKSASGKTTVIASTCGNVPVPGATNGAVIGLNVYKRA